MDKDLFYQDIKKGRSKTYLLIKHRINSKTFDSLCKEKNIHYKAPLNPLGNINQSKIVELYLQGKTLTELGDFLGHPAEAILARRILLKNKISLRPLDLEEIRQDLGRDFLNKEGILQKYGISSQELERLFPNLSHRGKKHIYLDEAEVLRKYQQDLQSIKQIGVDFNCSEGVVKKILLKNNIDTTKRNRKIDEECFYNIDCGEKAYILGLLFTDGAVHKNGTLSIERHQKDRQILEDIKEFLKFPYEIKESRNSCYLRWYSKKIVQSLEPFGIIPNKTYLTKGISFDLIPVEFQQDFLRGLFDGDGAVSLGRSSQTVGFCSYFSKTVQDFIDFCVKNIGIAPRKIFKGTAFFCSWGAKADKLKMYDYLYGTPCSLFLKTKQQRFLSMLTPR